MGGIAITGADGFLGKHLVRLLPDAYPVSSKAYDLRREAHIDALLKHCQPDIIIHLAADVGGLQYNLSNPATIYHNNVMMNTQLIHKAALRGCHKFIFISSVCAYPQNALIPTREQNLWDGQPELSNLSYGISKRIVLPQLQAYRQQFGMKFEYPILANLYGPGDCSDHVIPMLIQKFLTGKTVEVWGNGKVTRNFLFVRDAAKAIFALTQTDIGEAVNIADDTTITIRQLVEYLTEITNYTGKITWQADKPLGQTARHYNIDKAIPFWQPETKFIDGLRETVEWQCKSL